MNDQALKAILESLIFVSGDPLTPEKIREILEGVDKKEIQRLLSELVKEYEGREGGIRIVEIAGGYQMITPPDHASWIRKLKKAKTSQRLSKPSLETLAIIAYKQPVVKAEIEEIRGVDSSGVLKGLLDKRIIKIVGRMDVPGKPLMYGTTREFLQYFGLKDLSDLPTLKEFEEMAAEETAGESFEEMSTEEISMEERTAGEEAEDSFPAGSAAGIEETAPPEAERVPERE